MNTRIWIKNKKYYLYGIYNDKNTAYRNALRMKKTYKSKYFIVTTEQGLWLPESRVLLYLDKPQRIW